MRYPIRIDALWRPFLLVGGATRSSSFVELSSGGVRFKFGTFETTVPYAEVSSVHHGRWSLLRGIGWRLGPKGGLGLIGSTRGVVDVRFRAPQRMRLLGIPLCRERMYVSLERPNDFVDDLRARLAGG